MSLRGPKEGAERREGATFAVDHHAIERHLERSRAPDAGAFREAIARARRAEGLGAGEVATLLSVTDPEQLAELTATARDVKERIYGRRLVLFAPLYLSNRCGNECTYCAFRARNQALVRRSLSPSALEEEVRVLVRQGHKRVLLVAGEAAGGGDLDSVLRAIDTIYAVKVGPGEIRRVNVNIAPLQVDEFRQLKARHIGTYQLFQETYHRPTYEQVHLAGPKRDFDWRLSVMDRAMEAGIDDVGIGALFGLYDWRYEVLALLQHAEHLETRFGAGPHTISVPRLEPALGSSVAEQPPRPVSDEDFRRLIAVLRLAVPYTGIILSTRETAEMRRQAFALGVSQLSAGSRTDPGGYAASTATVADDGQFCLGDHRSLDEVVCDIASLGYFPSFCTACYRMGRTGSDFMDLAKPGEIRLHCEPNALGTFQEYLRDYAAPQTRAVGTKLIAQALADAAASGETISKRIVEEVCGGGRDVCV